MKPSKFLLSATVAALAMTVGLRPTLSAAPPPAGAVAPASTSGASPQDELRTATPIKHVVVLFDENVSFDHYFATYPKATNPPGEPSFTAAPNTPRVNNLANAHLLTRESRTSPTRRTASTPPNRSGWIARRPPRPIRTTLIPRNSKPMMAARADLFPKYTGKGTPGGVGAFGTKGQVMGYFDGNTVMALWQYAQHFAMSDNAYTRHLWPIDPRRAGSESPARPTACRSFPPPKAVYRQSRVLLYQGRPGRLHDDQRR